MEIQNNKKVAEKENKREKDEEYNKKENKREKERLYSKNYRLAIKNGTRQRTYKTNHNTQEYKNDIEMIKKLENRIINLKIKWGLNKKSVIFGLTEDKRAKNDDVGYYLRLIENKEREVELLKEELKNE